VGAEEAAFGWSPRPALHGDEPRSPPARRSTDPVHQCSGVTPPPASALHAHLETNLANVAPNALEVDGVRTDKEPGFANDPRTRNPACCPMCCWVCAVSVPSPAYSTSSCTGRSERECMLCVWCRGSGVLRFVHASVFAAGLGPTGAGAGAKESRRPMRRERQREKERQRERELCSDSMSLWYDTVVSLAGFYTPERRRRLALRRTCTEESGARGIHTDVLAITTRWACGRDAYQGGSRQAAAGCVLPVFQRPPSAVHIRLASWLDGS
jgi:hypothetical protein